MKMTHKEHGLAEDRLRELYERHLLSDSEIGRRHGISGVAVSYYRKKYGIRTLSPRDRIGIAAKKAGLKDVRETNKGEFLELYKEHGERGLARIFGASRQLIRDLRNEYGILPMEKDERIRVNHPDELTQVQEELIYGSLLGDGCVSTENGKSARYQEHHCFEQVGYLKWKQAVLQPFSKRLSRDDKMLEDGRIAYGYTLRTCYHSLFVRMWEKFYRDDEKRLPLDFEDMLSPMIMAVWYMDDGHLSDKNKDGVFTLASGFPSEDIDRIVARMNDSGWDVEPVPNSDVVILWINNKDRFHGYISDHVHSSMLYKIPVSLRDGVVPIFIPLL